MKPQENKHKFSPHVKIKIISNTKVTNLLPSIIERIHFINFAQKITHNNIISLLSEIKNYDVFLVFNSNPLIKIVVPWLKLITIGKIKIIFFDELLQKPKSIRDCINLYPKILCLKFVDLFICLHRYTKPYEEIYKIPKHKIVYVPFKANNYEIIKNFKSEDNGYVLSCGASHRDYETFLMAMRKLSNIPGKIILPNEKIAKYHNTYLRNFQTPKNVQVVRHDFDKTTWNTYLSKCSFLVLPINKDAIQPAGISVYLEAMALGKAVIITDSPSTKGLLTKQTARIVPPSDPWELQKAIKDFWDNKTIRKKIAEAGKKYALSLGGEKRLVRDILEVICTLIQDE